MTDHFFEIRQSFSLKDFLAQDTVCQENTAIQEDNYPTFLHFTSTPYAPPVLLVHWVSDITKFSTYDFSCQCFSSLKMELIYVH